DGRRHGPPGEQDPARACMRYRTAGPNGLTVHMDTQAAATKETHVSSKRWVSLHTHSAHSPRDGLSHLADLVSIAAADGQPALAVTDHGTLSGAWKLAKAAAEAGIKPIIGMEAYLAIGSR